MEASAAQQNDLDNFIIRSAQEAFGFLPNLLQEMMEHNPAVARTYLTTMKAMEQGTMHPAERETVVLTISRYNDCHYCSAAHGKSCAMVGVPEADIEAVRTGQLPDDERLRDLVRATRLIMDKHGALSDDEKDDLRSRGISASDLYEITALIGIKTLSNFVNQTAQTTVDEAFQ
ncbi:carboxymuconolactone decarboxylase family protein [Salisaeta longa]|uniref:carboxymuconolactone decarboxylase family protein n=1 Tax=Salisaeta longa TaxID=503170 RepID=UPI0003B5C473|nr:carboxymuconolactone decarboxylase family protein [Salisaeta longa]